MMNHLLQPDYLVGLMLTVLLSAIAYFIKQLHSDFKRVVKELGELKSNSALIHSETRSANELLKQRMDFIEWRLDFKLPVRIRKN
nr:hypothetical protein [Pseudopedobacter sp.]